MPVYYYIDLYYDPDQSPFSEVVDGCISAMVEAGCSFHKVVMSSEGFRKQVSLGEHVEMGPGDIGKFAAAYAEEMIAGGHRFISFPPMGRVIFEYPFRFDEALTEELEDEEAESHSKANQIGLNFTYSEDEAIGRKIKASMSFWEEYVLTHGDREANKYNMTRILEMVVRIYGKTGPYFGAMNNELRLNTDGAYDLLMEGRLPAGNEFAIVGNAGADRLDKGALGEAGVRWKDLPDGGVMIQFENKWS